MAPVYPQPSSPHTLKITSLLLCLATLLVPAHAEKNCTAIPVELPIRNVTLSHGHNLRGIPGTIGTPPQPISFWIETALNTTLIKTTASVCPEGDAALQCVTRKGGLFDMNESSTCKQDLTLENFGGQPDTRLGHMGIGPSTWKYAQDTLTLEGGVKLDKFPVLVPEKDVFPSNSLGLAPNSSLVTMLHESGKIPAKSFSIYWGLTGPFRESQADGSLVLGGYDAALLADTTRDENGQEQERWFEQEFVSTGTGECFLRVTVERLAMVFPDGRTVELIDRNDAAMRSCIANHEQITLPSNLASRFRANAGPGWEGRSTGQYFWGMRWDAKTVYQGSMIVQLSNGLEVEIPNHQLVSDERYHDEDGELQRGNDTIRVVRLNENESVNARDLPLLGLPFLSQVMVGVDYDRGLMRFARARPRREKPSRLVGWGMQDSCAKKDVEPTTKPKPAPADPVPEDAPSTKDDEPAEEPPAAPLPVAAIAGGAAGGVVFVALLVSMCLWRRRWRRVAEAERLEKERVEAIYRQQREAALMEPVELDLRLAQQGLIPVQTYYTQELGTDTTGNAKYELDAREWSGQTWQEAGTGRQSLPLPPHTGENGMTGSGTEKDLSMVKEESEQQFRY